MQARARLRRQRSCLHLRPMSGPQWRVPCQSDLQERRRQSEMQVQAGIRWERNHVQDSEGFCRWLNYLDVMYYVGLAM